VRYLVNQARDPAPGFVHGALGYNYRLSNLAAALGLAQLERLPAAVARKRALAERYRAALAALPGVRQCHPEGDGVRNGFWLYSLVLDTPARRAQWLAGLAAAGIQSRPFFTPLHRQPYLPRAPFLRAGAARAANSDFLADRGLHLPSSANLSEPDLAHVIRTVRRLARRPPPAD
jgi:dTDP-4-amino-4,6-dideoxygalactose transaminase